MKPRIKSMIWNIRKQRTMNQNDKNKKEKNENSVSSLWDNSKYFNIRIIGVPEEKRKSKKWQTYLKTK